MSKLPTKTQILDWARNQKYRALEQFDTVRKAAVYATFLGTPIEDKANQWNTCIAQLRALHDEMQESNTHRYSFNYGANNYMEAMVRKEVTRLYGDERKTLEAELSKVINNLAKAGTSKRMLEYLKACDMPYPSDEAEAAAGIFDTVDVPTIKPWLQNLLTAGDE